MSERTKQDRDLDDIHLLYEDPSLPELAKIEPPPFERIRGARYHSLMAKVLLRQRDEQLAALFGMTVPELLMRRAGAEATLRNVGLAEDTPPLRDYLCWNCESCVTYEQVSADGGHCDLCRGALT